MPHICARYDIFGAEWEPKVASLGRYFLKLSLVVKDFSLASRLFMEFEIAFGDASEPVDEDAENDVDYEIANIDAKIPPTGPKFTMYIVFKEIVGFSERAVMAEIRGARIGEITSGDVEEAFHVHAASRVGRRNDLNKLFRGTSDDRVSDGRSHERLDHPGEG